MTTTIEAPREGSFRFHNIQWDRYLAMIDLLGESHLRVAYSEGTLEVMTLSIEHESSNKLLGRFIETVTEEMEMPMKSAGSTTFNRADLERGLEPDSCYYLANEPLVRAKKRIDLSIDPPPDLALEIEITRGLLNRIAIYVALGVPEIWRFDGRNLTVLQLHGTEYRPAASSRHFPFLPIGKVEEFLLLQGQMDETSLVRKFREWVREQKKLGWTQSKEAGVAS